MLKKTITYKGYDDVEHTEDFYFNLSRAEIIMMEASKAGGMRQYYERIVQKSDSVAIMECFRDLIRMSVGEKSPDGKRFIKSEEFALGFEQSEAYSELLMEILSDADKALAFFNQIMPASISDEVRKQMQQLPELDK